MGHKAQVLRNDLVPAQALLRPAEQLHPGTFFPVAFRGALCPVRDGEILVKAPEMVDTGNVVHLVAVPQPGQPPVIAGLAVVLPAVQGIAPQLAVGREPVGRTARHRHRDIILVQLEQLGVGPGVGAVHGHINGNIADDFDPVLIGIGLQRPPLLEELELEILLELNFIVQLLAVIVQ